MGVRVSLPVIRDGPNGGPHFEEDIVLLGGKTQHVRLILWPNRFRMNAFLKRSDRISFAKLREQGKKVLAAYEPMYPYYVLKGSTLHTVDCLGRLHFSLRDVDIGSVTHEAFHVAVEAARRRGLLNLVQYGDDEETCAEILDTLVGDIETQLSKVYDTWETHYWRRYSAKTISLSA